MILVRLFLLILVFKFLLVKEDGILDAEKGSKKEACSSPEGVARAQNWSQDTQHQETGKDFADIEFAPLEGSSLFAAYQSRNGDFICNKWMVMRYMQENALTQCVVLRPLWTKLGRLCNSDSGSAWANQFAMEDFMEWTELFWKIEKPQAKSETPFQEEAQTMESRGSLSRTERSCLATSSRVATATDAARGKGLQRCWKGIFPSAWTAGALATAAAANALWPLSFCDAPLDSRRSTWCTTDAPDASFDTLSGYDLFWAAADDDDTQIRAYGRSGDWHESPGEIEQNRQSSKEGGKSFCRIPKPCPRGDQEGQQRMLQKPSHCGDSTRQSKRSAVRSGDCKTTIVVPMASLPTCICLQVEGIYSTFPGGGSGLSGSDTGSWCQSQTSTKKIGPCQKAHGRRQQGRDICNFLGRGARGDGCAGADRRECSKDPGGAQTGGDQFGDSFGISRQAGAQSKKTPQRGGWHWRPLSVAKYAAFWTGRRCVTEEYLRQWPLQGVEPTLDTRASQMFWSHSILLERNFLAPWQAIEQAADLAHEVGADEGPKVEYFQLPKRRHFAGRIVRFQEQVQVYEGVDVENEFHASQFPVHHGPWHPLRTFTPKERMQGDTGSSGSRDTGAFARQGSAGSDSCFHFLDRSLPFDTPNYIQHLQHLWRERHNRIEEGEYYRLRTWYIHHQHVRQWKQPRIVEVEGDGTTWHQDVLQAWRDQLRNNEVLNIAVVHPEVRAPSDRRRPPHADLLLVQGGQDRCGGIATVYLPDSAVDELYTWAISYARHLSGLELLQGAEADHFLLTHEVKIYHDWTPIPTTATPTHWMLNGHSFVVTVYDRQETAATGSSTDTVHPVPQITNQGDRTEEQHGIAEEESATSDEELPPMEQLQGVQVFGLDQSPHHCFVHWTSYNNILFEVLRSIGLPRDAAVGYHYFDVSLIDQHLAEEAILLQKVGDVPGGSPDRLVLLDLTYLAPQGDRPLQRREVLRLPRFLGRLGLLQELGIQDQCESSDFKCIIHHNNQLWHEDDLMPRQLQHAAYIRIEVPPTIECESPEHIRPAKRAHVNAPVTGRTMDQSHGSTFVQLAAKRSRQQPQLCSATFPSLRAEQHGLQGHPRHRLNMKQTHEQAWLLPASMKFVQCATTEYQDEGPVIHWTTWYLHHQRYTRNSESRLLRLDSFQHHWYQDLCNLWSDVLDPFLPGRVHYVHPPPPTTDKYPLDISS